MELPSVRGMNHVDDDIAAVERSSLVQEEQPYGDLECCACCFAISRGTWEPFPAGRSASVDAALSGLAPSTPRRRGFAEVERADRRRGGQGGESVASPPAGADATADTGADSDGAAAAATAPQQAPPPATEYIRRHSDTLAGLALRYRTDIATLLRVNRLTSSFSFSACATLLVPAPAPGSAGTVADEVEEPEPGPQQAARVRAAKLSMLQAVAKLHGGSGAAITPHEASFYLSDCGDDVEAARRQLLADLAWEREGGRVAPEALLAAQLRLDPRTLARLSAY